MFKKCLNNFQGLMVKSILQVEKVYHSSLPETLERVVFLRSAGESGTAPFSVPWAEFALQITSLQVVFPPGCSCLPLMEHHKGLSSLQPKALGGFQASLHKPCIWEGGIQTRWWW